MSARRPAKFLRTTTASTEKRETMPRSEVTTRDPSL